MHFSMNYKEYGLECKQLCFQARFVSGSVSCSLAEPEGGSLGL